MEKLEKIGECIEIFNEHDYGYRIWKSNCKYTLFIESGHRSKLKPSEYNVVYYVSMHGCLHDYEMCMVYKFNEILGFDFSKEDTMEEIACVLKDNYLASMKKNNGGYLYRGN